LARTFDQSPKEVELLHGILIRLIHERYSEKPDIPVQALVAELFPPFVDTVNQSKEASEAINRIIERYKNFPSIICQLGGSDPVRHEMAGFVGAVAAGGLGLALGAIIVIGVIGYLALKYN
jgi:hypothetical protein